MEGLDWNSFIPLFAGIVGSLIGALFMRRKNDADAKKSHQEGDATLSKVTIEWAKELRSSLEGRIDGLNKEYGKKFTEMSARIEALETHNALLVGQLQAAGLSPVPLPRRSD